MHSQLISENDITLSQVDTTNSDPFAFNLNNIMTLLSFFSPYVIVTFFTMLSFYFGSFQGLMYLGFTIFSLVIRLFIYKWKLNKDTPKQKKICNIIDYFGAKMPSFISLWLFSLTIGYILIPIFSSIVNTNFTGVRVFNLLILLFMFAYLALDIHVKNKLGNCFKGDASYHVWWNVLPSFLMAFIFSLSMTYSGNEMAKSLIYFNDLTSYTGTTVTSHCARVTPTKFKCSV